MKTNYLVFAVLALFAATLSAQDKFAAYEKNLYRTAKGDSMFYRLLKPENEVQGKKYPLVIFLHGAGEEGTDNEIQLRVAGQIWLNPVNREKYPTYVLFPQCPKGSFWALSYDMSQPINKDDFLKNSQFSYVGWMLKSLIETYRDNPQIDADRIYIMGYSMGGISTFEMAARFPELFAAAMPLCGCIHPDRLANCKDVSFRIYQGDDDKLVPVEDVRKDYLKLKEIGAKVEYFEYPSVGHGVWYTASLEPSFMEWIFSQHKRKK